MKNKNLRDVYHYLAQTDIVFPLSENYVILNQDKRIIDYSQPFELLFKVCPKTAKGHFLSSLTMFASIGNDCHQLIDKCLNQEYLFFQQIKVKNQEIFDEFYINLYPLKSADKNIHALLFFINRKKVESGFCTVSPQGLYQISQTLFKKKLSLNSVKTIAALIQGFFLFPESVRIGLSIHDINFQPEVDLNDFHCYQYPLQFKSRDFGFLSLYIINENFLHLKPLSHEICDKIAIICNHIALMAAMNYLQTDLLDRQNQLRKLNSHCGKIREEERISISRELHDEFSPLLAAIKMGLYNLEKTITEEKQNSAASAQSVIQIKRLNGMIDNLVKQTRTIISALRPGILDDLGLSAAIEWLAEELFIPAKINFKLQLNAADFNLDTDSRTALFRVCQELFANIIRHAHATSVSVIHIHKPGQCHTLLIKDNGIGIKNEDIFGQQAFGIMGIKERAYHFKWHFSITGNQFGTEARIRIPIRNS
jgi:signal transduction histidine kinase